MTEKLLDFQIGVFEDEIETSVVKQKLKKYQCLLNSTIIKGLPQNQYPLPESKCKSFNVDSLN